MTLQPTLHSHRTGRRPRTARRNARPPAVPRSSASMLQLFIACALAMLATNCSSLERLRNIGEQPALDAIQNPTTRAGYKPVQMPMPAPQPAVYNPNSLWRNGSVLLVFGRDGPHLFGSHVSPRFSTFLGFLRGPPPCTATERARG